MKRLVAIGILLLIVAATISIAWLFLGEEGKRIPRFSSEYLSAPANRSLPIERDPLPVNLTPVKIPYNFQISWAHLWEGVYTEVGGVYKVEVNNTSENLLYVRSITLHLGDEEATKEVMRVVEEELDAGVVYIPGPGEPGTYNFQIELDIYSGREGLWHHYRSVTTSPRQEEVEELPFLTYYHVRRDGELYHLVNDKIWDEIGEVRGVAREILGNLTGEFGMDQVIYLFRWTSENIEYLSDPGGVANYWASPMETFRLRAGDCEDVALFLGAMLTTIGGSVRVVVAASHAYLMLYVGEDVDGVVYSLQKSYTTPMPLAFFQDSFGFWLVIDPLSHAYPGTLPISTVPSLCGGPVLLPGEYHFGYTGSGKVLFTDIFRGGNV